MEPWQGWGKSDALCHGGQLRTQMLEEAMASAAAHAAHAAHAAAASDVPQVHVYRKVVRVAGDLAASPVFCLACTVMLAVVTLLVLRPPFVLLFEHDARRPWKGSVRMSWFAVSFATLCTLAVAGCLPIMFEMASRRVVLAM